MKVKVQVTLFVDVEIPDDANARFQIEENSCPGTNVVGAAILAAIEQGDETSTCWACTLGGENKIISQS